MRGVDAVVYSLVLCSVPGLAAALAEARRTLAPVTGTAVPATVCTWSGGD